MNDSTAPDPDPGIGSVLGRVVSGVYVLTASNGAGHETGMLASWVQQAAFSPPLVTVAVNRSRYLNDWLSEHPFCVLNVISESQKELLRHFGRGFEPDAAAFDGIECNRSEQGLPILSDSLGYLECRSIQQIEAGDHFVYVLEILNGAPGPRLDSESPMVHIRKNGFGY